MRGAALGLVWLALGLGGCAAMERRYVEGPVPWAEPGLRSLACLPEAEAPAGLPLAQAAVQRLSQLTQGAVPLASLERAEARLILRVTHFQEQVEAGLPRRVAAQAWPAPARYEADARTRVQLELNARILDAQGQVRWAASGRGNQEQSHVVVLPYPAIESLPAPAYTPQVAPDLEILARLRQEALAQALRPLAEALRSGYRLEPVDPEEP